MKFKHFGTKTSFSYYYNNQVNSGPAYIVGWYQFHLPNISAYISKEEVLSQARVAHLMLGLVPKQIEQFVGIMQYLD